MRRMPVVVVLLLVLSLPASTAGAPASPAATGSPVAISGLKLTPDHFRVRAKRGPHHVLSGGARISFVLSEAAEVHLVVAAPPGCASEAKTAKIARACLPMTKIYGLFSVTGHAGRNTIFFSGKLRQRPLRPGTYRVGATPVAGRGATATFTIL